MNFWHRNIRTRLGWVTPGVRRIYGIHFLLLFTVSTLLYISFPSTREWRRVAEENQLPTIILSWDDLAWYLWLAAAPLMLVLIRRYPLSRGNIRANMGRIILGSFGLYLIVVHVRYLLRALPVLGTTPGRHWLFDPETYAYNTFSVLPLDFLTFGGFFAISFSINHFFQDRLNAEVAIRLKLKTVQLQSDLDRAELAALRGQLHPHFLFNSFNALATLVRQGKNETAVEIIAQLSALLRLAIDRAGLHEIPLEQELDFIRRYLEIEQLRYGDKLRIEYSIEPVTLAALVPNIVLQPLVENAIKHGISLRTSPGRVRLVVARVGGRLQIEIVDDGPDSDSALTKKKPGIGLANARAQLDKVYGTDYQLQMIKCPTGGMTVKLDLPWRLSAPPIA